MDQSEAVFCAGKEEAVREKRRVAITSVLAALLLTGLKVVVGFATGSLGILSEAAHSAMDLMAALVTVFAVQASAKPADDCHPYGHGKFETLSALFETLLLLGTCVWIIYEAVQRLFFKSAHVEASVWAFAVILISIVVDVGRSRALQRTAEKYSSQALEADALHFATDVWSSAVVLFGLAMVVLARLLHLPWLVKADALAALAVAGIVAWVSFQLGKKTIEDLLDAVPRELVEQARVRILAVEGVERVERVRMRKTGGEWFSDIVIQVDPSLSIQASHHKAHEVEAVLQELMPGGDVVVHVEPAERG